MDRLYCGHGPVVDSVDEKIKFYIDHREKRDQEIIDAMVAAKNWQISSLQVRQKKLQRCMLPFIAESRRAGILLSCLNELEGCCERVALGGVYTCVSPV